MDGGSELLIELYLLGRFGKGWSFDEHVWWVQCFDLELSIEEFRSVVYISVRIRTRDEDVPNIFFQWSNMVVRMNLPLRSE